MLVGGVVPPRCPAAPVAAHRRDHRCAGLEGVLVTRGLAPSGALAGAGQLCLTDKTEHPHDTAAMRSSRSLYLGQPCERERRGKLAYSAGEGSEHAIAAAPRLRAVQCPCRLPPGWPQTRQDRCQVLLRRQLPIVSGGPALLPSWPAPSAGVCYASDERSGRTVVMIALRAAHGWLAGFTLSDGCREDCPRLSSPSVAKVSPCPSSVVTPSTFAELGRRLEVAQAVVGGMTPEGQAVAWSTGSGGRR